jgi:hypothetical protein
VKNERSGGHYVSDITRGYRKKVTSPERIIILPNEFNKSGDGTKR